MGKYAIFIVSALIFSLLTYSSALRNALFISNTRTVESHSINQAYNISESAMMVVINDIRSDPENSAFNPDEDSTYYYPSQNGFEDWVEMHGAYNIAATNQGDTLLTIQSTGRYDESRYRVNVGLVKTSGGGFVWPPLDAAVHADESMSFSGSGTIYGNASINGTGANNVYMGGNPNITGTMFIGPGGNPDEVVYYPDWHGGPGGGVSVMPKEKEYKLPEYPDVPALPTGISLKTEQWNDPTSYSASQFNGYYIPELSISQNRSMALNVGDQDVKLYVGNLNIPTGHLNIVGSGNLEIHVVNNMTLASGSSINCNAQYWTDANNCSGTTEQVTLFYGGSGSVNFSGGTFFNGNMFIKDADLTLGGGNGLLGNIITGGDNVDITGGAGSVTRAIYAPNADVRLTGGGNVTGAIVSKTYYSDGGTWVDYDTNLDAELPDLPGSGGGTPTFTVSYWN